MMDRPTQSDGVVVALSGGLGNQLFQLAAGLFVSGEAPVLLDHMLLDPRQWHSGRPDVAGFQLPSSVQLISSKPLHAPSRAATLGVRFVMRSGLDPARWDARPQLRKCAQSITSALTSKYLGEQIPVFGAFGHGYDPRLETLRPPALLVGYFQTWKYATSRHVRKRLLAMEPQQDDAWTAQARALALQENPLIVHVRLGDYRSDSTFGIPSPEYYAEAFELLSSRNGHDRVWLFSDEPEQALQFMPMEIRKEKPRLVRPPNSVDPVGVMSVMRCGNAFLLANSTFGYWSALLSKCEPEAVTIPDPWFRKIRPFDAFAPINWIRVPGFADMSS